MLAMDRNRQPIAFSEPLWSSVSSTWAGYALEQHRVGPLGALRDFGVVDVLLEVCISGRANVDVSDDSGSRQAAVHEGHCTLLTRGPQAKSIAWVGTRVALYVHLDAETLERLLAPSADVHGKALTAQYAVWDPPAHRLALCMRDEALAGCLAGPMYAQSLSLALTQHLWARYAVGTAKQASGASLSGAHRTRLESYIEAHLDGAIGLLDLADVVGLSPHYFTQVFKNTYGTTPHRHVTGLRIEAAKRWLQADAASISEVGLLLGFADQSHFTSVFHRATGRTPLQFRRLG